MTKRCPSCSTVKPVTDFYTNPKRSDGLSSYCKECARANSLKTERVYAPVVVTEFVTEKRCRRCNETKPSADFYANNQKADGLASYCKACALEYARVLQAAKPKKSRPPEGVKKCSRCKEIKPVDEFGITAGTPTGLSYYCKLCASTRVADFHKQHPEKHREYAREWGRMNPDKKAAIALKNRLGVPHDTYATMLAKQDGKCAICGTTKPGVRLKRFHVDHCHDTGDIRALLCSTCNTGLGFFKHNVEIIHSAIAYLRRHRGD